MAIIKRGRYGSEVITSTTPERRASLVETFPIPDPGRKRDPDKAARNLRQLLIEARNEKALDHG